MRNALILLNLVASTQRSPGQPHLDIIALPIPHHSTRTAQSSRASPCSGLAGRGKGSCWPVLVHDVIKAQTIAKYQLYRLVL